MLYLIGGAPRTGKSSLALQLARQTSLSSYSIDHLTQLVVPYIPEADRDRRLALRAAIRSAGFSNDAFYATHTADQAVALYRQQAEALQSGLENFIRYALAANHPLIVEGWQLLPTWLRDVVEGHANVRVAFLYRRSVSSIAAGLKDGDPATDWVVRNTQHDATFDAIAAMISRFGEIVEREAHANGFPAINTDEQFKETIERTAQLLMA